MGGENLNNKNYPREEGSFRRPPLAEFGVEGARFLADHTMGVRGTAVRPRGSGGTETAVALPHSRERAKPMPALPTN